MKTEVEMKDEEVVQKSKHLSPILHAKDYGLPGEERVLIVCPREFIITLSDGTRQRVSFTPGTYSIPKRLSEHGYLEANGVQIATAESLKKPEPMKTEAKGTVDWAALNEADMANIDKMDQLKAIWLQIGGSADDFKASTSKAEVRGWIVDKAKAELAKADEQK